MFRFLKRGTGIRSLYFLVIRPVADRIVEFFVYVCALFPADICCHGALYETLPAGFVVVSGLALGCDTIGHENALCNKGFTIAVLPSGIHNIYPESNKRLAEDIVTSGGCLISEYEPKATAVSYTFVERDALIAALSKATLVLECGIKSGTMKTVEVAEKLNRKIACYYSKRKIKEGFEGNNYILNTKTSYKVVNKKGLRSFLTLVDAEGEAEAPVQISLL